MVHLLSSAFGYAEDKVLKFLQAFMAAVHRKRVDPERVELSSSDYELLKMLGTIENETDSRYSLYDQYFTGASLKGVVERSCEIAV